MTFPTLCSNMPILFLALSLKTLDNFANTDERATLSQNALRGNFFPCLSSICYVFFGLFRVLDNEAIRSSSCRNGKPLQHMAYQVNFEKHEMSARQLQDLTRKRAQSSQMPCYTVFRRKVKKKAPLCTWVTVRWRNVYNRSQA